jgi:hypothetical protein
VDRDLAKASPTQIDTELYRLYLAEDRAHNSVQSAWESVHLAAGDRKTTTRRVRTWAMSNEAAQARAQELAAGDTTHVGIAAHRALARLTAAQDVLAANLAEQAPLNEEYDRRPWTRAYLAVPDKGEGHVHSSRHCSTCHNGRYMTRFAWMPGYAGKTQEEIIQAAGYRACTVCFPDAPVGTPDTLPTRMFSEDEVEAARARQARADKATAAAAKKAAAGITNPDGTPLKDDFGMRIAAERTAQTEYVNAAAEARYWTAQAEAGVPEGYDGESPTEWLDRCCRNYADHATYAARLLAALAHKRGTDIHAQAAALAPKVDAKYRKDFAQQ